MKILLKRLTIALRYNSQGEPISFFHQDFPEPLEMVPYTVGIPKGFVRVGLFVNTKFGDYKVVAQLERATSKLDITYEHKALIPMPCGADIEVTK